MRRPSFKSIAGASIAVGILLIAVTACRARYDLAGSAASDSPSPTSGRPQAAPFELLSVNLRQGARLAANDPSGEDMWILTVDDGSKAAILTKLAMPAAQQTDYPLSASPPGWLSGAVLPAEDGSVWLAYGLDIVHFDPASDVEQDVAVPNASPAQPIVAAVMINEVIWVAVMDARELQRYSSTLATWLSPVVLPLEVGPDSQLLSAGSRIVITGAATSAPGNLRAFATITVTAVPTVSNAAGDLASIATTQAGGIVEFGTDGTLTLLSAKGDSTTVAAGIPAVELVASRPWVSDASGHLWSWVWHWGDSLMRLDPITGAWTYYIFPDVSVNPESISHGFSRNQSENVVASPQIQTISATSNSIVVTTRAGQSGAMQSAYGSAYTLSP